MKPDPHDGCEAPAPEAELHRLWSPAELQKHEESRQRFGIGRALSQLAADAMSRRIQTPTVIRRLRGLADHLEGKTTTAKKAKPEQADLLDDARTVFEHWQKVANHPKAKLDPKRRKMIQARLKDFSVVQLKAAVEVARGHHFWGGEDTRDGEPIWIDGWMKLHSHVEKLVAMAEDSPQLLLTTAGIDDDEIEEMEKRAQQLSEEGKIDEANEIQAAIRRRLERR